MPLTAPSVVGRAGPYLLVLVLAVLLAVWGAFLVPLRIGGVPAPVGVALALATVPLALAGGRLTGSRLGAAGPYVLWLLTTVALSSRRPEGDLVIVGGGSLGRLGLAFILVGMIGGGVAVALAGASPRRPGGRDGSGGAAARPLGSDV